MIILYVTHKLDPETTMAYGVNQSTTYKALSLLNGEYDLGIDLDSVKQEDNIIDCAEYTIEVLIIKSVEQIGTIK